MDRIDRAYTEETLEDTVLDQDFDEWQSDSAYDAPDLDAAFPGHDDHAFAEVASDSHFMLRELDFAGDFETL